MAGGVLRHGCSRPASRPRRGSPGRAGQGEGAGPVSAQNSAAAHAAALRAGARGGPWRRLLALLGLGGARVRRADAEAARWAHGAAGEETTARLLAPLETAGWHVRHDLRLQGRRFNIDTALVPPCGTVVVVLDTKNWRRGYPTTLDRGRVHCGTQDRHDQVVKVAGYAQAVGAVLPGVMVVPLLVVHGSQVAGGGFEAPVPGGTVWVLGTDLLVPRLAGAVRNPRDRQRAAQLAGRVDSVLRPYTERS
ncbi:nuclease-related domain-containing protein [Streptomyces sp. NPDC047515]|uniref:nuclease-related domain-containing protein n=1 Tax=Streptomyces sp. NPDC047515 TaxID=3155380 RepID=UPI0033DA1503